MKLIAGLGNPGDKYKNTRHNLGFMALDYITNNANFYSGKFDALEYETTINGEKVLFIKPQKFINLSGEVIKKYLDFYKLNNSDLLVIHDDFAMNFGKVRVVFDSSDGGHNGIKNIQTNLVTKEYLRLKVGIYGNNDINPLDYVLGKFTKEQIEQLKNIFYNIKQIVPDYYNLELSALKEKYNH